jgi:hypothetical protein
MSRFGFGNMTPRQRLESGHQYGILSRFYKGIQSVDPATFNFRTACSGGDKSAFDKFRMASLVEKQTSSKAL